jgi:hypothetical protein
MDQHAPYEIADTEATFLEEASSCLENGKYLKVYPKSQLDVSKSSLSDRSVFWGLIEKPTAKVPMQELWGLKAASDSLCVV